MSLKVDLIFHAVSRRKWRELNHSGFYIPENIDDTGKVLCVTSEKLTDYLNQNFKGRKNLLILVVDVFRLASKYSMNQDSGYVEIDKGINVDAILDKIRIDCGENGLFDVKVESK